VILRYFVQPRDPEWGPAARGAIRHLDVLWTDGIECPACGYDVEPARLSSVGWNLDSSWWDGHVEAVCGNCASTGAHAFDVSPLARFPQLAAKLVGLDLAKMTFDEKLTTNREGIDEQKERVRTWTAGDVTIRLRHAYQTNYPSNEMQWYFSHDSLGEIESPSIKLSVRELAKPQADDAELAARWQALLAA
jgi:hypothetical protein